MKKLFIVFILIIYLLPVKVFAVDYKKQVDDIVSDYTVVTEVTQDIDIGSILEYIKNRIMEESAEPLRLMCKTIAMILCCSFLKISGSDENKRINILADTIVSLLIFVTMTEPVKLIISTIYDNLLRLKNFMVSFLPVFSLISLSAGEILTSTVYSGFFLTAMVFMSDICINIVLPSLRMYIVMIISNAMSPYIKLKSLCDFYIKSVKWTMKSAASLMCILLTFQSTLLHGRDTLTVKAGKMLAGSAVPVVGTVLQDAVSSVYAAAEVIKGYAGAAGIIAVVSIFFPSLVVLTVYWICFNVMNIAADITDTTMVSSCIKGFIDVTELLISVIVVFSVLFIFSLTLMISLTNGV